MSDNGRIVAGDTHLPVSAVYFKWSHSFGGRVPDFPRRADCMNRPHTHHHIVSVLGLERLLCLMDADDLSVDILILHGACLLSLHWIKLFVNRLTRGDRA
jgi:hypothetical protein